MDEPHWLIISAVGAAMPATFNRLYLAAKAFFLRRQGPSILGTWYCYFFSYENGMGTFEEGRWTISAGWVNAYVVNAVSINRPGLEFSGTLKFEKNFALVELLGTKQHMETVWIRFLWPVVSSDATKFGLSLQYDFDGEAHTSVNILTRNPMSQEEAEAVMARHSRYDREVKAQRVICYPP